MTIATAAMTVPSAWTTTAQDSQLISSTPLCTPKKTAWRFLELGRVVSHPIHPPCRNRATVDYSGTNLPVWPYGDQASRVNVVPTSSLELPREGRAIDLAVVPGVDGKCAESANRHVEPKFPQDGADTGDRTFVVEHDDKFALRGHAVCEEGGVLHARYPTNPLLDHERVNVGTAVHDGAAAR